MKSFISKRFCSSLLFICLFVGISVSVQGQTITSVQSACENDPVFLSVSGYNPTDKIQWWISDNGTTWEGFGNLTKVREGEETSSTVLQQMRANTIWVTTSLYGQPANASYSKQIKLNTTNCQNTVCRTTTTGDYFQGTDFDYEGPVNWNTTPPGNLVQYFSDNNVLFQGKSGQLMNQEDLGIPLHIDDSMGVNPNNNFYVKTGAVNENLFSIIFPNNLYRGKTYRFTMRFYLIVPKGCTWDPNASIMTRTGHGTVTTDNMDVDIYYESDQGRKSELVISKFVTMGSDVVRYKFYRDIERTMADHAGDADRYDIFRFEMVYYGYMPTNTTANYDFKPFFEQFPSCPGTMVAVDYISAEAATVCVDPRSACVGQTITVNASGFPRDAVYKWTKYSDNTYKTPVPWSTGEVSYEKDRFGQDQKANITMKSEGNFYYRVSDGTNSVNFTLTGEDCGAIACPTVTGADKVCLPTTGASEQYTLPDSDILKWEVANGGVKYQWSLIDPSGADKSIYVSPAVGGLSATANFPGNAMTSDATNKPYKMVVVARRALSNEKICSDSLLIMVNKTPDLTGASLDLNDNSTKLCASTLNGVKVSINPDQLYENIKGYTIQWTGAESDVNLREADLIVDQARACAGTDTEYAVGIKVINPKNTSCFSTLEKTFPVIAPEEPTIKCLVLDPYQTNLELGPKQSTLDYTVPDFGAVTVACGTPTKTIVSKNADGTSSNVVPGDVVKLPAGTSLFIYTVKDGCDKTASCTITVVVSDANPPLIDCGLIEDSVAYLSKFSGCAVVYPSIKAPVLNDLNGVDGTITGRYLGRKQGGDTQDSTKYNKTIGLLDEYPVGNTYILWGFSDKSGNTSVCSQKVTVIDDLEPRLSCPSVGPLNFGADKDLCELSWAHLEDSLETALAGKYPSAVIPCPLPSQNPTLTPTVLIDRGTGFANNYSALSSGSSYRIAFVFYKSANGDTILATTDTCFVTVNISDKQSPALSCENWTEGKTKTLTVTSATACSYKYTLVTPPATIIKDNCSETSDLTYIYSVDGAADITFVAGSTADLQVGKHTITWKIKDELGNVSEPCDQTITVNDDKAFTVDCTDEESAILEDCGDLTWDAVNTRIKAKGLVVNATYTNCTTNLGVDVIPSFSYKEKSEADGAYKNLLSNSPFYNGKTYTVRMKYVKEGDYINRKEAFCYLDVLVADTTKIEFKCDDIKPLVLDVVNSCDTLYKLPMPKETTVSDNCSSYENYTFYYSLNGGSFVKYVPNTSAEALHVGNHELVWKVADASGNEANNTCAQEITVKDNRKFEATCTTAESYSVESCTNMEWVDVKAALPSEVIAKASYTDCNSSVVVNVAPTMYYKRTTETTYTPLTLTSIFENGVTYDIQWHFVKSGLYMTGQDFDCYSQITVKDKSAPVIHCSEIEKVTLTVDNGCSLDYQPKAPFVAFVDVCVKSEELTYFYKLENATTFTELNASSSLNLTVGSHTLTWKASDKAGNESQTCDQIIEVNDNRRMDLSCPESDGTFIVETCGDLDGQSVQDSLKKLNKFATAKYTECNTNNEVKLTPVVEYALKGSTAWNPMNASATFKYNTEYTVRWTFTKSGEHIVSQTEKCELDILLKDTTAPVFDCKNLADLAVLININREQQLEKYASAKGQTTQNPKTTYTLKDRLKIPSASDVYDNCSSSQVKVTVEVTGPINEAGQISTTSIADLDALEKHKFYIGEHTIHFKFTDNTGNESVCEQKITVLEKFKPIPNCSSFDDLVTTLNADANCSAKLEMTTSDVPTANMSYWYEVKYKNYENYSAPIVLVNDSAEFAQLPSRNSLTVPKSVTGYPYKLVKVLNVDADLNMTSKSEVSILNNTYNSQDTINAKYVQHRFYPSTGGEEIKLYQHFDDDAHPTRIKRTNFASLPEDLLVFPKGTHKLVWHFVNNIGEEDSCETKIEVLDKTNPTITCPVDEELSTSAESQNCNVSYTLDAANVSVSDNCPAEFKYQYKIDEEAAVGYSGAIDVTLSVGSHIITWIVFDEAGNSAECSYNVTVKDETKPEFDCPAAEVLTTEPNSKVCEVPFNKSAASLNAQDNCSTELVYSYKIDDKDEVIFTDQLNVNLPVGEHILTWLVKDEAGNVSSCTQKVTVKDVTLPVFDCSNINPFTVRDTLEGSDCEAPFSSIQFNEYIAEDNCSSIKGILSRTQDLSGEIAADEKFKAGVLYDLYWIFQDTSGNKVTCDQKVELFSQKKPSFNCDSLKEAVITEVLQSRCEIPAAELNVNTPHAVDVCTGAVIEGVGRRTSGRAMADIYPVGRDTIVWVFESPYSSEIDSCEQYVFIQSDMDLKFDCDSLNKAVIDTVLHATCNIEAADLKVNTPFALDACTNDSIWGVGVRTSGKAMTDAYPVGRDTINWTFISEFSTDTVVCQQFVYIQSDNAPIFNCDSLNNAVIDTTLHGVCEISAADLNVNTPFALDACTNDTIWGVGTRTSGKAMTEVYPVGRDTIVWVFDSEYSTNTDTCKQFVYIKSDKDLIFDCDSLNNAPVDTVLHDVCEISSADLAINTPFAIDACTSDTIWGVGQRSSGKDMADVYPVGRDTITWTFISEYTTDTVTCEQFVYVKSDKDLIFDCDSLNNAPIDTVLNGVCKISAADLKVNTPFALDACTKDTIWGVGVRTSGKLLTDAYAVGRDTINWTFISEFSTDTVVCQQFVYIQSDIEPIFDCDSLNKAVIDTTLDGVCEISATDLNVNRPFALDACTNDTIWGVGTRTSGRAMTEKYIVGRDTINWKFISEFSTDTVVCQQFIYIKSSSDLIFDCYSLNEEVIDTVLHDVCEISAVDLNIDTPYALDACTKDTIWGIGTRTSGRAMTEKYIVGRDTITWTFISEYSTDTVICHQFVYIKSDKDLIFDCDSLNNAPVDTVLHDVCEISSADLAINTPFAIDPCTIDTIWGVGQRSSGKDMTDVYPVGRDTITWTFISEYTTDTVTCEQFVYVKSDKDLIFDCDSLNNAPIDTVLNGVCEISAADLKVNTPFALDACTKDTIWGVGARTSGKAMTDAYPVGRDTINWTFISDFSTDTVVCQQFVYIQSDNAPIFNCDSLNNAVIDTTLHGVCEISATDLNVNTPFALDACTNDTIFGVGTRTSGKTMTEVYPVGRDTIVWVFDSEYSTNTDTDTCRQFVYIKSDIAPVFNCDSLNNAVIDTVLHDACVISAADLNVNIPFALDACTKDTVWGVGTRTSGKLLTDDYPVGRDTIVWVFNSEFSTTIDSCEQFVYIKSDKELKFNCDTLRPIVLNPTGCDTIMPLGSISVPYALDACTNDTIWGVGKRLDKESLDLYTEPYSVGQTYIEWTFTSQYSTIVDTCRQLVDVRTLDSLIFACSDINPDTIKVEVKTGECAVSIDDVPMGSYQAQNPCTNEMVDGIAMVGDKRFSELDSLAVGVTLVTWVFTDMSSTLKDSVVKCEQYIQIGDVNKMPVDCRTFEDQSITRTLDEGNCTLDYVELDIHHDEVRDLCTNKIIEPYISRYNVIIADSVNYADPYKVGQDTLYWKYVFRGQEVVCKQVVTINNNYTPNFDCSTLNPLIVDAEKGTCSVEAAKIGLEEHFATDSCNMDLKIQGTGTRSDSLSLAADYPVGRTIITWTFTNMYSDSTVSKICEQIVDVIGDNKTQIACDSLLPIKGDAFAGDCTIDPQRLGIEIPVAVDSCIADLFIPGIGIRSDSTAESPKSLLNDVYPIGETSITWTFVSPYSHEIATCVQYVQVKDSIEPTFDCTTLDTIRLASEPAECFALLDSVKARLTQPVAVDSCTNKEIEGVVSAWDGSELPEKYAVGDTVSLKWTFIDSTINNLAKVCEQVVLVTGDQKPKVNCDSLWSHPIEKTIHDTCEVNLEMADIPVPFALDACTNDTIKGEGQRLDGSALTGVYPVGKTTIRWTFVSPFSSDSAVCEQYIHIKTDLQIDVNCDTISSDTVKVTVEEGKCFVNTDLIPLKTPLAFNVCTGDTLRGVATVPDMDNIPYEQLDSLHTGLIHIVWTFKDTTSTLVDSVATCDQYIKVGDSNELPVKCDSIKHITISLKDNCVIPYEELNISVPDVIDLCTNELIIPDTIRYSVVDSLNVPIHAPYTVGQDTLFWSYKFGAQVFVCKQVITLLSTGAPQFDCDQLDSIAVTAKSGSCTVPAVELNLPNPIATDTCNEKIKIPGTPVRSDSLDLLAEYPVGRTLITWTFTSMYSDSTVSKVCKQIVEVMGDNDLIFDCDSLQNNPIEKTLHDTCEVQLTSVDIITPFAIDSCTLDTIYGQGRRLDEGELYGTYQTGKTYIEWVFNSEWNTKADTCVQLVHLLSDKELIFNCDSLQKDTMHISVADGVCDTVLSVVTPYAVNPCTGDSIEGVPSRSDNMPLDSAYSIGLTVITWTFTDKSETLVDSVRVCEQYIQVGDNNQLPVDCNDIKDTTIILDDVCEIAPGTLNLMAPMMVDWCSKQLISPDTARTSGRAMTDVYPLGQDTVIWTYKVRNQRYVCDQVVTVMSDSGIVFNCDDLMPIVDAASANCNVLPENIDLNVPVAFHPCTKDSIIAELSRPGVSLDDPYQIGVNELIWTFTDRTGTLVDSQKVCRQVVEIKDTTHLHLDCSSLADRKYFLDSTNCTYDIKEMDITAPEVRVTCPDSLIEPAITRSSGLAFTDPYYTGKDTLTWSYSYKSMYMDTVATCTQVVEVVDSIAPYFPCDTLQDFNLSVTTNYATPELLIRKGLYTPKAYDKCMNDSIEAVGYRSDSLSIYDDFYPLDESPIVITWVFTDDQGNSTECHQEVNISFIGDIKCPTMEDITVFADSTNCSRDAQSIDIITPYSFDNGFNRNVDGVGYRSDNKQMTDPYQVGKTFISWLFVGYKGDSLFCPQKIEVKDTIAPDFNCESLENIEYFLKPDSCIASSATIGLEIPTADDACSEGPVYGVGTRSDGEDLMAAFAANSSVDITWTFTDVSENVKVCHQNVTVKDTNAPVVRCEELQDIAIIWTENGSEVPYERVAEEGLNIHPFVKDSCDGVIWGVPTRSDLSVVSPSLDDTTTLKRPYEVNATTTIVWTFTDKAGNSSECSQKVIITDMPEIPLTCPTLYNDLYSCDDSTLPAVYTSWSEFKKNGGYVSDEAFVDTTTFKVEETITGQCKRTVTRVYTIEDLKGRVAKCEQVFSITDTTAPVIVDTVINYVLSCKDDVPAIPTIKAIDACQGEITAALVENVSTQSSDPNTCECYNYTITRVWRASDGCGNVSDPLIQTIAYVDTIKPYFEFPAGWRDTVLAKTFKGCRFLIPDFRDTVKSIARDNCTDVSQLTVQQVPAPDTKIEESQYVSVYVSDRCGNEDTLTMFVLMSSPKSIVNLKSEDASVCVSDSTSLSLWSQSIRFATGSLWIQAYDDEFIEIPSTFTYDCYRDYISESTLVYSDNPNTYFDKFYNRDKEIYTSIRDSLTTLKRRSQSGRYCFVAMDTITLCSDTAYVWLDLKERPRVALDSGVQPVCENDTLELPYITDHFNLCVDPKGGLLRKEGWMLDSIPYESGDTVLYEDKKRVLYYMAENECGVSTSLDSYFSSCLGLWGTTADSIAAAGSKENLDLLRQDKLIKSSYITVDVHQRYSNEKLMLTTNPNSPARVWYGDNAKLILNTDMKPARIDWYRVVGEYDARRGNQYDIFGNLADSVTNANDEVDHQLAYTDSSSNYKELDLTYLTDSAMYYVVVSDDVCPAWSSNVASLDVLLQIPTAITPFDQDGLNDVFMERCPVVIFNRYGQKIHEGTGWDGTSAGELVDPGVYFYQVSMPNGVERKGTIEVVKF